jgi:ribose transport system substrate-binding protein
MFRQVAEEHPAGIHLSATGREIFKTEIDTAAQGIPVICVDADVPDSKRVLYIGTDNVKAGRVNLKQMSGLEVF